MYRVLVIGERPEDTSAIAFRLGLLGLEAAPSAGEVTLALRGLFAFKPDVIVLDVTANNGSRELFRLLERVAPVPIFVVGDGSANELVSYLEEGAVDYLPRPVSPMVLEARINAVLRRLSEDGQGTITVGDVVIDLDRRRVRKGERTIQLTPTEFRLLQVLAENAGRACSHEMLLRRVWGDDFKQCAHYLRLYIGYLRHKLEDDPRNPRLLTTEWGVGYRLAADRVRAAASAARATKVAWA